MMSTRLLVLVSALMCSAHAASEASYGQLTSQAATKAMEKVFARSEKAHSMSMATIMNSMSPKKAWQVLEKGNLTTPALMELTSHLHGTTSFLRKADPKDNKGYSGIDGARKLLNDMIYESMSKYDNEIAECTEFYSSQCAAMEMARGEIASSNDVAANSRSLILDAQGTINKCEVDIPTRKWELKNHNRKCDEEKSKMRARLAVIEADIAVITTILKMTDCEKKSFVEMRRCEDPCTQKSFLTFNHDSLKQQVAQLQSSASKKLMQDNFADLFEGIESLESVEFLQLDMQQAPNITKTPFNNPPVPRTEVPGNPCNDEFGGGVSPTHKRAAKCTISKSPQCYKLQERFLLIQSGIKDEKDALLEDIASMEAHCEETKQTLETQIKNDNDMLSNAQTKLGRATEKEATAGEEARQTANLNNQLNGDLKQKMKKCSGNYINFETELCALKKIRGELYKMKGSGHSAFFQDCEVDKWEPEACSKDCKTKNEASGEQKLVRSIMTHPDGGAKCLPLAAMKKCNLQPCPVDCKLAAWSGWSKCSADCGGGVQQRLREVTRAMRSGGKPCDAVSQTKACNIQSCEKDCELSEWSKWSWCSKDCDGGTRKRQKFITKSPKGIGECPDQWSPDRMQYKKCNEVRCPGKMECKKELDIVFLLDGSGSLGANGWKAEIKAANTFVDSFSGSGAKANMAVILYSGPRTWGGVYKCIGRNSKNVDMEKTCKIKSVTHFTSDMAAVKKKISALTWPKGSTLTSLALLRAKAELSLGRKDAKSIVVVITDGRPLSYRKTGQAARFLRKSARLIWVPVTRHAPLRYIKKWATRRWQENLVRVKDFKALEKDDVVTHLIANICPGK